jgi:hypothetical protein
MGELLRRETGVGGAGWPGAPRSLGVLVYSFLLVHPLRASSPLLPA